jgi:predicted adenylyl cyclase CyaB
MARNVEIKARVDDLIAFEAVVQALGPACCFDLEQDDTFFACENGRLKLREFSSDRGELIFYERADQERPKVSHYDIVPISHPRQLCEVLSRAYGPIGRVRKRRRVYLIGQTRVHLDHVELLGQFVELEVVLQEGQAVEAGEAIARNLMDALGIRAEQLVAGAYIEQIRALSVSPAGAP